MQYFKNVDLAKLHAVSEGTVRRWIDSTRQGKLDLQLYEVGGKYHIANTSRNTQLIKNLVERGKKHVNSRWHKIISPGKEFYDIYDTDQVVDIITSIDIHREIPVQYEYFDEGAQVWDNYTHRLASEEETNILTTTTDLIQSNFNNIDRLLEGYEKVNVIDIGVGNGLPAKELITHFLYDRDNLGRYIGLDVSQGLLDITEANLAEWFEGRVKVETHLRDITYQRFNDLLIEDDPEKTANVVLLLGGMIDNFRAPDEVLRVIYNSLGRNSLLLMARKIDTAENRRYFDFHTEPGMPKLPLLDRLMVERLNIDESLYESLQGYNPNNKSRYISFKPTMDITIKFDVNGKARFVHLNKGEIILLWRAWHFTILETINQLDQNGFTLADASTSSDDQYVLIISKLKIDSHG